jgi:hypothetical protein
MEQAKEIAVNTKKTYVSRYSSLLSIIFAAMLGRPEKAADCSLRVSAAVTRLYEPALKIDTAACCAAQSRLPEGDEPAVDFETMYRPMPANRPAPRASVDARVPVRQTQQHQRLG